MEDGGSKANPKTYYANDETEQTKAWTKRNWKKKEKLKNSNQIDARAAAAGLHVSPCLVAHWKMLIECRAEQIFVCFSTGCASIAPFFCSDRTQMRNASLEMQKQSKCKNDGGEVSVVLLYLSNLFMTKSTRFLYFSHSNKWNCRKYSSTQIRIPCRTRQCTIYLRELCMKFALSTTKFPTALPQCQNTVGIPLKCAKKRSSNRVPVRTAQTPHTPANCFLLLSSSSSLLLAGAVDAHFIRTSNQHTSACASIGFQLCPFI